MAGKEKGHSHTGACGSRVRGPRPVSTLALTFRSCRGLPVGSVTDCILLCFHCAWNHLAQPACHFAVLFLP